MRQTRGFTMIELIAVVVVLVLLAVVALPRFLNHSSRARESADAQSIAAINTALIQHYTQNRVEDAAAGQWVTDPSQVAGVMEFDELPNGIRIVDGPRFEDQRGNRYRLEPETEIAAARIVLVTDDAGGGAGGGGGAPSGAADVPAPMILVCLAPWLGRERRRDPRKAAAE